MRITALVPLALLVSCSTDGEYGDSSSRPATSPELGANTVILPAACGLHVDWLGQPAPNASWDPTAEQVARIASLLRPALESGLADPTLLDPGASEGSSRAEWIEREVGLILDQLEDYRRQYVGIITHGGRIQILVRCFPGPDMDPSFPFETWREEIVVVSDGGADYWYAVFDVERGVLVYFDSNGYA